MANDTFVPKEMHQWSFVEANEVMSDCTSDHSHVPLRIWESGGGGFGQVSCSHRGFPGRKVNVYLEWLPQCLDINPVYTLLPKDNFNLLS